MLLILFGYSGRIRTYNPSVNRRAVPGIWSARVLVASSLAFGVNYIFSQGKPSQLTPRSICASRGDLRRSRKDYRQVLKALIRLQTQELRESRIGALRIT